MANSKKADRTVEELLAQATDSQVRDLKATVTRLQRALDKERDRTEAISKAVSEAIQDGLAGLELPDFTPPQADRRKGGETAIMVVSDWQLGKKTPTYSSQVCEDRVRQYATRVGEVVEIQRLDHPVKRCAIFALGDMVEGELIFPGQAHLIDASLYQQVTIDGPRIMGGLVKWASDNFEEVDVYCVPGNHGYLGGRARKDYHPESNADRMLYTIVEQVTANLENVTWHVSLDWWAVADLGERSRFLLLHGDQVRGYAGLPWYGYLKKVLGWASLSRIWPDMDFDHMVSGHFHTPTTMYFNGRRVWVNASTESHNPYALEQLGAAGEPAQWLLFAKPGRGVSAEYLIQLD